MQVYRGMDIGTAKPSAAQREQVRHHLIDVVDIDEAFDAAEFVHRASLAEADIQSRGKLPILCGGTGLYFQAWWQGLGEAPPSDPAVRAELESTPHEARLAELQERDPVTFSRIDRANARRVIRALEVVRLTGRPFSLQRARWSKGTPPAGDNTAARQALFLGLTRDRADLRRRIDERVDWMFANGLVEEVERLLPRLRQNKTAGQALGYRQVSEYLAGLRPLHATMELVKQKTRQYAKRQFTWFRHQVQLDWIQAAAGDNARDLAERIVRMLEARG